MENKQNKMCFVLTKIKNTERNFSQTVFQNTPESVGWVRKKNL